jgi:hypothetical protein
MQDDKKCKRIIKLQQLEIPKPVRPEFGSVNQNAELTSTTAGNAVRVFRLMLVIVARDASFFAARIAISVYAQK